VLQLAFFQGTLSRLLQNSIRLITRKHSLTQIELYLFGYIQIKSSIYQHHILGEGDKV